MKTESRSYSAAIFCLFSLGPAVAGCAGNTSVANYDERADTDGGDAGGKDDTSGSTDIVPFEPDDACTVPGGPSISDLQIEANPNSALSCYVTWHTDFPASSEVFFGERQYDFRVYDDTLVTEHKVFVIGLHAESRYFFRAVSEFPDRPGRSYAETSFRTGALPEFIPVATPGPVGAAFTNRSWTLVNISDPVTQPRPPAVAVMYDDFGLPVWYYIDGENPDTRGDIDVRLLDGNTVLIGPSKLDPPREVGLDGTILWEGPPQEGTDTLHHHFDKLADGNYIGLRHKVVNDVVGDAVEIMTPDGEVVWEWNAFDHLTPEEGVTGEWTHANSVTVDLENDLLYLSLRNFWQVLKINMIDGDILWRLGEDGDFLPDPDAELPWFIKQHDPFIEENGNILLYDNDDSTRGFSRVVEYAVDEETLQSKIVFEFPGDFDVDPWYRDHWFTYIWGDVDRLENGNILVTAGTRVVDRESRVFEVTQVGEVVRELKLPQKEGTAIGVYRAQRISAPPLIEVLCNPGTDCERAACSLIDPDKVSDVDSDEETDAGLDAGLDAGIDSDTGTEPDTSLFPMEWTFDTGWDDFVSDQFTRDASSGTLDLAYTFTAQDEPPVVFYKDFEAADWTGAERIELRLHSIEYVTGGWEIVFFSSYAWSPCKFSVDHEETREWTTVVLDLLEVCGDNLSLEMAQQLGVVAVPGPDAVFPETVHLEVDSITVFGSN